MAWCIAFTNPRVIGSEVKGYEVDARNRINLDFLGSANTERHAGRLLEVDRLRCITVWALDGVVTIGTQPSFGPLPTGAGYSVHHVRHTICRSCT